MVFGQWPNSLESIDLPVDQNGKTYEDMVETLFTGVKPVDDNKCRGTDIFARIS